MVSKTKAELGLALHAAGIPRRSFSIPELAARHGFSEAFLRSLIARGLGPRVTEIEGRNIVTTENEDIWLRERASKT